MCLVHGWAAHCKHLNGSARNDFPNQPWFKPVQAAGWALLYFQFCRHFNASKCRSVRISLLTFLLSFFGVFQLDLFASQSQFSSTQVHLQIVVGDVRRTMVGASMASWYQHVTITIHQRVELPITSNHLQLSSRGDRNVCRDIPRQATRLWIQRGFIFGSWSVSPMKTPQVEVTKKIPRIADQYLPLCAWNMRGPTSKVGLMYVSPVRLGRRRSMAGAKRAARDMPTPETPRAVWSAA